MNSLIQYFKNSRITTLNLSESNIKLWCNQRQFALYFEMEERNVARSLWSEIHDDKLVAASIKDLNLRGVSITINDQNMLIFQELTMLECPSIEKLDISGKELSVSRPAETCWHFHEVLENLPSSIMRPVKTIKVENYCLHQLIPPSHYQVLKEILIQFENLETVSFAKTWFYPSSSGKDEVLRTCIETLQNIEHINLSHCYISKDVGHGLSRIIKNKVKRGSHIKIRLFGTSGEGVQKLLSMLSLSKHVYYEIDQDDSIVNVQKV